MTIIKYTNIINSKALRNFPKFRFLGLKISHLATLRQIMQGPGFCWWMETGRPDGAKFYPRGESVPKLF
jgi:hypothetical protein